MDLGDLLVCTRLNKPEKERESLCMVVFSPSLFSLSLQRTSGSEVETEGLLAIV